MKSLVMKSIYAGLGLLGTGKQTVAQLARELAKKADISEKEGEKIARQLSQHSEKAIGALQKTLNSEVTKVVKALHAATESARKRKGRRPATVKRRAPRRAKRATSH